MIEPYNDTLFQLRRNYFKLFGKHDSNTKNRLYTFNYNESEKVYKIKYTLNILPKIQNSSKGNSLISAIGNTSELQIFEC